MSKQGHWSCVKHDEFGYGSCCGICIQEITADLERQLAEAQEYIKELQDYREFWIARNDKAEIECDEAQKKLKYQEPMIEWYKVMVEWFSKYVRVGESNQQLLPRLARILKDRE